jgi:electron transfer flavoprotein alpha subunit
MAPIFAYVEHRGGVADDAAAELVTAARKIDAGARPTAIVTGAGPDLAKAAESLRAHYAEVWTIANDALAYPNAELVRQALSGVLPAGGIVVLAHNHLGMDLAPGLAVKTSSAIVTDVLDVEAANGSSIRVVRQEFGGQVSARVRCDLSSGAVITVRPGAFRPADGPAANGQVVDKSGAVGALAARRRYVETLVAEAGDVDITKHAVLVSVGRGIQDQENVSIAEELAEALGAAVSCSRPVVDAKWLEKSRQVGTSGKTVKPRVYLACGISGAFQHLAGIKGSAFMVAINKNPKAPIFQRADVGIVDDVLEFLPALTEKVRERQGA